MDGTGMYNSESLERSTSKQLPSPTVSTGDLARSMDTDSAALRPAAIRKRGRTSTEAPVVRKSFRVATAKAVLSSKIALENATSLSSMAESEDNSDFAVVTGPKPKRKRAHRVVVKVVPENTDEEQPEPSASTAAGPGKRKPKSVAPPPPPPKSAPPTPKTANILCAQSAPTLRAESASGFGLLAGQPGVQVVAHQSVGDQLMEMLPFLERLAGIFRQPVAPNGMPSAGSTESISIDLLERLGRIGGLLYRPT
jgi:hypothetical protein